MVAVGRWADRLERASENPKKAPLAVDRGCYLCSHNIAASIMRPFPRSGTLCEQNLDIAPLPSVFGADPSPHLIDIANVFCLAMTGQVVQNSAGVRDRKRRARREVLAYRQ